MNFTPVWLLNDSTPMEKPTLVFTHINPLGQGFSNFFLEGPDEIPMKPQRART